MSTPYLGQISMFGGNYAPVNWAFCNGQIMAINQNQALFAVLGTTYGGNGVTTFALPNLISRLSVDQGTGPGLSTYALGQPGGAGTVTITPQTMPTHTHTLNATQTQATATSIGNTVLPGKPTAGTSPEFYSFQPSGQPPLQMIALAAGAVGNTGGTQPHNNLMPSLCITFIIALQGIFPSRS
jgi:microcystin-dependent protein